MLVIVTRCSGGCALQGLPSWLICWVPTGGDGSRKSLAYHCRAEKMQEVMVEGSSQAKLDSKGAKIVELQVQLLIHANMYSINALMRHKFLHHQIFASIRDVSFRFEGRFDAPLWDALHMRRRSDVLKIGYFENTKVSRINKHLAYYPN
jgi:hypothetical protein